jgi:predicted ester cyclase
LENEANAHGRGGGLVLHEGRAAWAEKVFDELPTGAFVCEAVLAEACHLACEFLVYRCHTRTRIPLIAPFTP